MPRDLHNRTKYTTAIAPVAAAPTGTTAVVSAILDTSNFESNEFVLLLGSIADADVTFTSLLEEGDSATLADNTTVAAADMIGTLASTITAGVGDKFNFGFADDSTVRKIGYKGSKRYIRMTLTPAANSGNFCHAAVWAQGHPRSIPQSTQFV